MARYGSLPRCRETSGGSRDPDGCHNHTFLIANRRRDAANAIHELRVVRCITTLSNLDAVSRELRDVPERVFRVSRQGFATEQLAQSGFVEVGQQRLAVRSTVRRHCLTRLPGYRDHMIGGGVIDEQCLSALANRQMSCLTGNNRKGLQ